MSWDLHCLYKWSGLLIVFFILTGGRSSFFWELKKFPGPGSWSTAGGRAKGMCPKLMTLACFRRESCFFIFLKKASWTYREFCFLWEGNNFNLVGSEDAQKFRNQSSQLQTSEVKPKIPSQIFEHLFKTLASANPVRIPVPQSSTWLWSCLTGTMSMACCTWAVSLAQSTQVWFFPLFHTALSEHRGVRGSRFPEFAYPYAQLQLNFQSSWNSCPFSHGVWLFTHPD